MKKKLINMKTVKMRIKCLTTYAVLALDSFLLISITTKSADAVNTKPFTDYDDMYESWIGASSYNTLKRLTPFMKSIEIPDLKQIMMPHVHTDIDEYMVTETVCYAGKFKEARNDLVKHLQGLEWFLNKNDSNEYPRTFTDDELNFYKVQLYMQYLALLFCHRVFILRDQLSHQNVLSDREIDLLYGPDVKLLLTYLFFYGRHAPNMRMSGHLADAKVIDRATEVEAVNEGFTSLSFVVDYGVFYRGCENLAALENSDDRVGLRPFVPEKVIEFDKSIEILNRYLGKLMPDCYLPPPRFTNLKQEYDLLLKIVDLDVMDPTVGENKSRLSNILQAMVEITERAETEGTSSSQ